MSKKGDKQIPIVVPMDGGSYTPSSKIVEIKEISAKNPLAAYKNAVKSFCPPEDGGSNIVKKEAEISKNVLPQLYKTFSLDAEYSNFRGNALSFVMSQTPELANAVFPEFSFIVDGEFSTDSGLPSDSIVSALSALKTTGDDFETDDGVEFMRKLKKAIIDAIGSKKYTALVKSTQTLIKSAVFYFRFVNQPQLLICNDDDYAAIIGNFIGDYNENDGLFRTTIPYGLLPVPAYSRSVFKAQPDKEARFLEVFGVGALKLGYTSIQDMPKISQYLEKAEQPLAKAAQRVVEDIELQNLLLDNKEMTDEEWLKVLQFEPEAIRAFNDRERMSPLSPQNIDKDFETALSDAKRTGKLSEIGLYARTLRGWVRNNWTPNQPIGYNKELYNDSNTFRMFEWDVKYYKFIGEERERIIKKLIEVRNLNEKFDEVEDLKNELAEQRETITYYRREKAELEEETRELREDVDIYKNDMEILAKYAANNKIGMPVRDIDNEGENVYLIPRDSIYFGGFYTMDNVERRSAEFGVVYDTLRDFKIIEVVKQGGDLSAIAAREIAGEKVPAGGTYPFYAKEQPDPKDLAKIMEERGYTPKKIQEYLEDRFKGTKKFQGEKKSRLQDPDEAEDFSEYLKRQLQREEDPSEFLKKKEKAKDTSSKELDEAKDKIEELEEQNEILEELSGFYAAVLERLGIDADDLADDARSKGQIKRPSEFVNSEDFNEYIEVIERSLF